MSNNAEEIKREKFRNEHFIGRTSIFDFSYEQAF